MISTLFFFGQNVTAELPWNRSQLVIHNWLRMIKRYAKKTMKIMGKNASESHFCSVRAFWTQAKPRHNSKLLLRNRNQFQLNDYKNTYIHKIRTVQSHQLTMSFFQCCLKLAKKLSTNKLWTEQDKVKTMASPCNRLSQHVNAHINFCKRSKFKNKAFVQDKKKLLHQINIDNWFESKIHTQIYLVN